MAEPGKHERYEDSQLYRVRHSAAHIMAQAVLEKFQGAKVAIGPAIEDGFYYDFDLPRPLSPEDLEDIEKRMREIIRGCCPSSARWFRRMRRASSSRTSPINWS